jgi:hypothetical protein
MEDRLRQVADMMDRGCSLEEMAAALDVEVRTARGYRWRVRHQRGLTKPVRNRTEGDIRTRFFAKVNKDGPVPAHVPHLGPCHEWTAMIDKWDYAYFTANPGELGVAKKKHYRAHRLAWILEHGSIPDGAVVMHKCDNKHCVRLDHLALGTHKDNMLDKMAKGRGNNKKLPETQCSHCKELGHRRNKCQKAKAA